MYHHESGLFDFRRTESSPLLLVVDRRDDPVAQSVDISGTTSPWLGQSLVIFDVVFLVVGLPSIVSARLGFQDLVFGVLTSMLSFIAQERLHTTGCDFGDLDIYLHVSWWLWHFDYYSPSGPVSWLFALAMVHELIGLQGNKVDLRASPMVHQNEGKHQKMREIHLQWYIIFREKMSI
ncbi:hypothetical protein YC2023_078591 [Brassica napus]